MRTRSACLPWYRVRACMRVVVWAIALGFMWPSASVCAQGVNVGGSVYQLADCLKDIDHAKVSVSRNALLDAYRDYLAELMQWRKENLPERINALSEGNQVIGNKLQAHEKCEQFRRSIRKSQEIEERFFAALQRRVTDENKPKLEEVRVRRANARLLELLPLMHSVHLGRIADVDSTLVRYAADEDTRRAVLAALQATSADRLSAANELLAAQLRAMQSLGAIAEEMGLAGTDVGAAYEAAWSQEMESRAEKQDQDATDDPEEDAERPPSASEAISQRVGEMYSRALKPLQRSTLALQRLQWQATVDAAAVLPPARARRAVSEMASVLIPELPMWFTPHEEMQRIMSWTKAPASCAEVLPGALEKWSRADDLAIRQSATKVLALLAARAAGTPSDEAIDAECELLVQRRRKTWNDFVAMLGPCAPPAVREGAGEEPSPGAALSEEAQPVESEYDEKRAELALVALGFDPPIQVDDDEFIASQRDSYDDAASGLPSADHLAALLRGLGATEEQLALAEQIRADQVERWATEVSPAWAKARDVQELWNASTGVSPTLDSISASAAAEFQNAFAAMTSAQTTLGSALGSALGSSLNQESVAVLILALKQRDPGGWRSISWRSENELVGGLRTNAAEVLALAQLPAAERAAAAAALLTCEGALLSVQRAARAAAVDLTVAIEAVRRLEDLEGTGGKEQYALYRQRIEHVSVADAALARAMSAARNASHACIEQMCQAVPPEWAEKLRGQAARQAFPSLFEWQDRLARVNEELLSLVAEDIPATSRLAAATVEFCSLMEPSRTEFMKNSRAFPPRAVETRHDLNTPEMALQGQRHLDLIMETRELVTLYLARVQEAVGKERAAKSAALHNVAAWCGIDIR